MKKIKIILLILWFRILCFLIFIIYTLYTQLEALKGWKDDAKQPIVYELNFKNNNIISNISESNNRWDDLPDPIVIGLAITWIDINNIKWIKRITKNINNDLLLESKYSNWYEHIKYFSIPKVPNELIFEAEIEYYNGMIVKSSNYFSWPILTIWADVNMPDIPLVSLKTDKKIIKIWDIVNFEAIAKVLSADKEFAANVTFQWDFNGDGIWDLNTGADFVQYIYTEPSEYWYRPRVAALYKWYKWIGIGGNIIVQDSTSTGFKEEIVLDEVVDTKENNNPVMRAQGGTQYEVAKANILSILPSNLSIDVEWLFKALESIVIDSSDQQDIRERALQDIINLITKNIAAEGAVVEKNQINPLDMKNIIMPNICTIFAFYSIITETCPN